MSRPPDRTGAYEEPEDNWWSHEREEHDRNTATSLVSVKICLCGSQQCDAATDISHMSYEISEQHKDLSQARQTRDTADSEKLMSFIEWRSPFDEDP